MTKGHSLNNLAPTASVKRKGRAQLSSFYLPISIIIYLLLTELSYEVGKSLVVGTVVMLVYVIVGDGSFKTSSKLALVVDD
jgi:hypothetical protein